MSEKFTHISLNQYCSDNFLCEQCLREEKAKIKGFVRYDSLVLCFIHAHEFNHKIYIPLRRMLDQAGAKTIEL